MSSYQIQDDIIQDKSNNAMNKQNKLKTPIVNIDCQKLEIRFNDEIIIYQQQMLTIKGLEVHAKDTIFNNELQNNTTQYLLSTKQNFIYDQKYCQNKYCGELAATLDRASNAAYQILKNNRKNGLNNSSISIPNYTLQICELVLKKIPLKSNCLQLVLRKMPLHKIQILLENDGFFVEVIKIICKIIYNVCIDSIVQITQKIKVNSQSQQQQSNFNQNIEEKRDQQQILNKNKLQYHITNYQQKVLNIFHNIYNNVNKYKLCYQRVNLIVMIFNKQDNLLGFFYQLNKQLICNYLVNHFQQIFCQFPKNDNKNNKDNKQYRTSQPLNIKQKDGAQGYILAKVIAIIKTVHLSLGKSETSFQIIRGLILTEQQLISWLSYNIEGIKCSIKFSQIFIQFLSLCSQIHPQFISTLYNFHHLQINQIISKLIKWICQTLNSVHPDPQKQQKIREEATDSLNQLIILCQTSIKQSVSATNIGNIICKKLCEMATLLRANDIQFLTNVYCINQPLRHSIVKYLLNYFRKLLKSMINNIKNYKMLAIKLIRKQKYYLIEIMQSIRKISQIENIIIDMQLITDIHTILSHYRYNNNQKCCFNLTKNKIDCLYGVYQTMIKCIKIQEFKDNKNDGHGGAYLFQFQI